MRKTAVLLLLLTLSACASSGGPSGDPLGGPRIRTVLTPSIAADGGAVAGSSTIRYVEDPVVVREVVEAPPDSALTFLLDALQAGGLAPDGMDPDRRLVSLSRFEWSRDRNGLPISHYLECGSSTSGGLLADRATIVGSIISQVSQERAGVSSVGIRFEAYAVPVDGSAGRAQDCVTTGRLEQEILSGIRNTMNGLTQATEILGTEPEPAPGSTVRPGGPSMGVPDFEYFAPGDQIRVRLSRVDRWTGTFLGFRSDSLLLKRSRVTPLHLSWVRELEVKKTSKTAVWAGALVGIAAGVAIATTTPLGITGDHDVQGEILNPGLGAVVGGLVGGFLGSSLFGTSWIQVPLEALGGG